MCSERQQYVYYLVGIRGQIYCSTLPKDVSARDCTKFGLSSYRAVNKFLLVYNITESGHNVT
jgi:hypothetical protein